MADLKTQSIRLAWDCWALLRLQSYSAFLFSLQENLTTPEGRVRYNGETDDREDRDKKPKARSTNEWNALLQAYSKEPKTITNNPKCRFGSPKNAVILNQARQNQSASSECYYIEFEES